MPRQIGEHHALRRQAAVAGLGDDVATVREARAPHVADAAAAERSQGFNGNAEGSFDSGR